MESEKSWDENLQEVLSTLSDAQKGYLWATLHSLSDFDEGTWFTVFSQGVQVIHLFGQQARRNS